MENFVNIARNILLSDLPHDGVFVNYTMTGGNDTLYMAKFVSEGNVFAFTKDSEMVDSALALFESAFQDNVHVIVDEPLNIKKYLTSNINGFLLNTVKSKMSDGDIKALLQISLDIMAPHAKGGILLERDKAETIAFLESLDREHISVLSLNMTNDNLPNVYIIEKNN